MEQFHSMVLRFLSQIYLFQHTKYMWSKVYRILNWFCFCLGLWLSIMIWHVSNCSSKCNAVYMSFNIHHKVLFPVFPRATDHWKSFQMHDCLEFWYYGGSSGCHCAWCAFVVTTTSFIPNIPLHGRTGQCRHAWRSFVIS